jgi:putative aldouronate transport system permease protein
MVKTGRLQRRSTTNSSKIFDVIITILMFLIAFLFLLPLLHVLACSFSSGEAIVAGEVGLFPSEFNIEGYIKVFQEENLLKGFGNSIFYTFLGTIIQVSLQMLCAYPLSRRDFKGRKVITMFLTLTMFIGGGMIPTFLLISQLKMLNTIWAMIIPGCISVFNIIVIRTYMTTSIPYELQEAARIDGCSDFRIFLKIILPLSRPILFVMVLYAIVGYWNNYFNALLYIQDTSLYPLQRVLQDLLVSNTGSIGGGNPFDSEQLKYVTIIVSSLPLLIIYPFFQKYFEKGVTIGGING